MSNVGNIKEMRIKMIKRLLTKTELANELDLSNASITKYINKGLLVFTSIAGKEVIDLDDALKILDANINSQKIKDCIAKRQGLSEEEKKKGKNLNINLFDSSDDEFEEHTKFLNLNELKAIDARLKLFSTRVEVSEKLGLFISKKEVDIFAFSMGDLLKRKREELVEELCSKLIDIDDELTKRKIIKFCVAEKFDEYEKEIIDMKLDNLNEDEDFDDYDEDAIVELIEEDNEEEDGY